MYPFAQEKKSALQKRPLQSNIPHRLEWDRLEAKLRACFFVIVNIK